MRKLIRIFSIIAVMALMGTALVACEGDDSTGEKREADVDLRWEVFYRAQSLFPVPADQLFNFPLRESLVKFVLRQDEVNHPWYIYLYAFDGTPIGYYVGQTYPQSACNFLSSSEYMVDRDGDGDGYADFVISAPSLDGMYYSGSGSNAACDSMFFFDATTDAMITFAAPIWSATDVPISGFTGNPLGGTTVEESTPADVSESEQVTPVTEPPPTEEGD